MCISNFTGLAAPAQAVAKVARSKSARMGAKLSGAKRSCPVVVLYAAEDLGIEGIVVPQLANGLLLGEEGAAQVHAVPGLDRVLHEPAIGTLGQLEQEAHQ